MLTLQLESPLKQSLKHLAPTVTRCSTWSREVKLRSLFIAIVYESSVREWETPALQISDVDNLRGPSLKIPTG